MKKGGLIVVIVLFALAGIGVAAFSFNSEKNKKNSIERNAEVKKQDKSGAESKDSASDKTPDSLKSDNKEHDKESSENKESSREKSDVVTSYEYNGVKYEFCDYEIIKDTDMVGQTRYPMKYFYEEDFDPLYLSEIRDEEAIKAESPELKDMWENPDKYSDYEEIVSIFNRNKPIIEKYTKNEHIESDYIFIKCKVTLLPNNKKTPEETSEICLSNLCIYVADSENENMEVLTDKFFYFDEPQHIEGIDRAHSYFFVTMHYGEEKEFILGVEVLKEKQKHKMYIGSRDESVEELGLDLKYSKYLVSFDDLHEGIDEKWIRRND